MTKQANEEQNGAPFSEDEIRQIVNTLVAFPEVRDEQILILALVSDGMRFEKAWLLRVAESDVLNAALRNLELICGNEVSMVISEKMTVHKAQRTAVSTPNCPEVPSSGHSHTKTPVCHPAGFKCTDVFSSAAFRPLMRSRLK
jgi:hypothetical protein